MVVDVAEIRPHLIRYQVQSTGEIVNRGAERRHCLVELEHRAIETVDPWRRVRPIRRKDLDLDLPDVRVELLDDRPIGVHDAVDDRVDRS